jgi:OOP family OmpA-OmpF porin
MYDNNHLKGSEKLNEAQLNELRTLITGLEKPALRRLQKLMTDPHEFAVEISELLPFSIRQLIEKGSVHIADLLPFFEEMIQESIEKNPQRLANLLFPIMGPAIRKAVSEDLKRLIESLNQGLESSLSPKHLKWRIQALFSKSTYLEIMLSHAYLFQVKHIFLIHRESALLLHHEKADHVADIEADMVASMLSAIGDFVRDSFHSNEGEGVDTIKIGETNLWIEQGPHAIIAAVVDGNPPPDLRLDLKEAIEAVHYNHRTDLEKFEGETSVFVHTSKFLKPCLRKEKKDQRKRPPYFALVILLLVCIGIGYLVYQKTQKNIRFKALTEAFKSENGYLISQTEKQNGQLWFYGLKDELARQPQEILTEQSFDTDEVTFRFKPFVSLDSSIVIVRAKKVLSPPETVKFSYDKGNLFVSGTCKADWLDLLHNNFHKVWGVHSLNVDDLKISDEPPIDLSWIIKDIASYRFIFDVNELKMNDEQQKQFSNLTSAALLLEEYNHSKKKNYKIQVQSVTSKAGNTDANQGVALSRAENFIGLLREAGVPDELLEAKVIYNEDLANKEEVRSVSFKVVEK